MRSFGFLFGCCVVLAGTPVHAEKRTYINPIDIDYRYNWEQTNNGVSYRTGADPAVVRHKGAYYLFQTLADGYWRSTNLIDWTFITPSRWPFGGIVAPAVASDGNRLIIWPSMSFTRPGSILVTDAPETGKLDFLVRSMQTAAVRESRMKIPLIFAADIIHGHRTIFPVPLAEVASFEPDLARRTAEVAAFEASGAGIDWNFSPMCDVARDQRWGRGVEGGGEDPLLGGLFAAARVRGFQGNDFRSNEHFLACIKHFAAYGAAESGLDYNTVDMASPIATSLRW